MKKIVLVLLTLSLFGCKVGGNDSTSTSLSISNSTPSSEHSSSLTSSQIEDLPKFTVTFVTNCEEKLESIVTNVINTPPVVSNGEYSLEGWYFESAFTNRVSFPYIVTKDITLYAKWVLPQGAFAYELSDDGKGYILAAHSGNEISLVIPSYYNSLPVVKIADFVFYDNQSIISVTFPATLEEIGNFAFYNCLNLRSIELPDGVKIIGTSAFHHIPLTSIYLGQKLQVLGISAFQGSAVTKIAIPSTIKQIGGYALMDCPNLRRVEINATIPPVVRYNSFDNSPVKIYVPSNALNTYKSEWSDFASILFAQ